jgi:hypothetical protein
MLLPIPHLLHLPAAPAALLPLWPLQRSLGPMCCPQAVALAWLP